MVYMISLSPSEIYRMDMVELLRLYEQISKLEQQFHYIASKANPDIVASIEKSRSKGLGTTLAGRIDVSKYSKLRANYFKQSVHQENENESKNIVTRQNRKQINSDNLNLLKDLI